MTTDGFASRLGRCIERSNRANLIEGVVERNDDHQIDEEMILRDEVSNEALEAVAWVALGGFPTLLIRYLLLRLSGQRSAAKLLSRDEVTLVFCLAFSFLRHLGRSHLSLILRSAAPATPTNQD